MSEEKQVIEINGVKLEVDMRYAKRIDTLRVGSKVKLLRTGQYDGNKVYPGVVVGFEPFDKLPTIIVAYLEVSYSESKLKFEYINSESEKVELIASVDDEIPVDKADVLAGFTKEQRELEAKMDDLNRKREYFLRHFNEYFQGDAEQAA